MTTFFAGAVAFLAATACVGVFADRAFVLAVAVFRLIMMTRSLLAWIAVVCNCAQGIFGSWLFVVTVSSLGPRNESRLSWSPIAMAANTQADVDQGLLSSPGTETMQQLPVPLLSAI